MADLQCIINRLSRARACRLRRPKDVMQGDALKQIALRLGKSGVNFTHQTGDQAGYIGVRVIENTWCYKKQLALFRAG